MKAHVMKFLTRQAEHHIAKSKHHTAMAAHFGKLAAMHKAKSDMGDSATLYQSVADEHGNMVEEHSAMAAACVEACKVLKESRKAAGMGDSLDDLLPLPEGLSTILPADAPLLRAVPRTGARELPANFPKEFAKVFSTEEETE